MEKYKIHLSRTLLYEVEVKAKTVIEAEAEAIEQVESGVVKPTNPQVEAELILQGLHTRPWGLPCPE